VLVAVVLGGGIWLTKKEPVPTTTTIIVPSATPTTATTGNVVEATVSGSEFKFAPNAISAKKGDTVRVLFKNTGSMFHDFVIDEFGVATSQLSEGEEEEVEFVASKSGSFEFYCSVDDHRAKGMKGTLLVTP